MGGGLMQLVAYGAQDIYLTGNPQITFFKVVYRRHTNFSMETIEQTVNGSNTVGDGKSATVTISRNGDLVHKVYVNLSGGTTSTAAALGNLKEVELEIGGQRIDRHSLEWLATWFELSVPAGRAYELSTMMGDDGYADTTQVLGDGGGVEEAQIPLQFWFCRNPGLALPLIALQYHEVKLKFLFAGGTADNNFSVLCDYIYLDTDERRRFAQVSHEYLIEQVQQQSETGTQSNGDSGADNIRLNFNHPVKELIWTMGDSASGIIPTAAATPTAFTAKLQLNGHDRFSERSQEYFGLRQPYDYHSAVPGPNLPLRQDGVYSGGSGSRSGNVTHSMSSPVFVYSFALKPEEHQPSGTCNFSRIDNAKLILNHKSQGYSGDSPVNYNIFAVNYNVLRIMSGMGGLAYSN